MNSTNGTIPEILKSAQTIAVVGLSRDPGKTSHLIASYLQSQGYRIIPVNPYAEDLLGEKSYPDLLSIPVPVDIVNVFRPSESVVPFAVQAVQIGAKSIWMQLGIVNNEAARIAREAGLNVIMNRCIMVDHRHLGLPDTT